MAHTAAALTADELEDLEHLAPPAPADNQQLSAKRRSKAKRPRRHRESDEMAGMVSRVAKAMVRRAAAGDLYALSALRQMREHVDQATRAAAQELHDPIEWSGGYSWTTIAQELGISRQAARQQFSLKAGDIEPDADADNSTLSQRAQHGCA